MRVCLLLCLHDRPCPGSLVSCRCLRHPDSREKQHLEGMLALAQLDHKKACKTAFEEHHQATALEMELNDVKATLASTKRLLDVRKLELKEGAPSLPWLPRALCSARMPRRSWTSSSRVCVKLRRSLASRRSGSSASRHLPGNSGSELSPLITTQSYTH